MEEKDNKIKKYLNSIYQNSSTGMQSINDILDKVYNRELKAELENQLIGYKEIQTLCEEFALKKGVEAKDNNWFEKAKMWTSVQMSTLMDNSTRHVAELLLIGTIMGLNVCYKDKWDYKNLDENLDVILAKLEHYEEEYYKNFKKFLKGDISLSEDKYAKEYMENYGVEKKDCCCHDKDCCQDENKSCKNDKNCGDNCNCDK